MASSSVVHDPRSGPARTSHTEMSEYSDQKGLSDVCALIVELEGLPYDYAFNEGDLMELFSRYGEVTTVQFLDATIAPDIAMVEFRRSDDAVNALNNLNNYSFPLDTFQVVLSVNYYDELMDKELQCKLRQAASIALWHHGPVALMTGSKYTNRGSSGGVWQCRFVIGAEKMERDFPIVGRIIGPQGSHMRAIYEKTGANLRLRGRRSNFKEGAENRESDDPMHLCVSSNDENAYGQACGMIETLLSDVYNEYSSWCQQNHCPVPNIQLLCVDGPFTEPLEWKLREFFASQAQSLARH